MPALHHRRTAAASLAAAALAAGTITATPTATAVEAAGTSPLVLSAPSTVTVRSHDGWVYSGFGVSMQAVGSDFEVRANRLPSGEASWWDPVYNTGTISATWKRWDTDGAPLEDVPLPADAMTSWQGLDDFARVEVFRDGQRIRKVSAPGCFNGNAVKAGPEGPVSSEYPWSCPQNPFTIGSVMGVSEGYATPLLPEWGLPVRLKPGTYTMRAGITAEWTAFFGIDAADATTESTLVVKKARRQWREPAARPAGADRLEQTAQAPTAESEGALADAHAPDLRSLPAFDISLNPRGTALRFGATVWNGGRGPLVIEGFRSDTSEDRMAAYQYYFDGEGDQTGYEAVGELAYHAANHDHWHFEDFARYRLLRADANGNLTQEQAVPSTKASFCLVATDAVDLTVPNADMRPEYTDLGSQCGGGDALWIREVLANGHGDTYHQFRAGQAFRIGSLEDGIYYIAVEANPDNTDGRNLQELDTTNNDSYRKVRLWTTRSGERRVRAIQVGVVEEWYGGFRRG